MVLPKYYEKQNKIINKQKENAKKISIKKVLKIEMKLKEKNIPTERFIYTLNIIMISVMTALNIYIAKMNQYIFIDNFSIKILNKR